MKTTKTGGANRIQMNKERKGFGGMSRFLPAFLLGFAGIFGKGGIVDIGGVTGFGTYSLKVRCKNPGCRVYSFSARYCSLDCAAQDILGAQKAA